MEEYEKIELRSDDVQEILGTPPSWILRWGITFVFMGVILLGVVSWIVKYPDIIHAPVLITTNVPPVPVVSRTTGYLSKLMVKEGVLETPRVDVIFGLHINAQVEVGQNHLSSRWDVCRCWRS